jgi:nucleotide-binding universal stress UspA family protein
MLQRKGVAALILLDEKVRQVKKMGGIVADSYYREGYPVEEVISLAEELGVGLIITGGRRLAKLKLFWSSSYPLKLFRYAKCPVLIVRGEQAE